MKKLTIDINAYCNEKCRFCYQSLDGTVLPEERILEIIDENPDAKTIGIGGGEPFLDKRIIEFIRHIHDRERNVHISTNATIIPENLLALEEKARKRTQIQVSLHASNPALYEQITGRSLFDRVIGNIKTLKDYFPTLITSAIYEDNFNDVQNIVNLAERLDLPLRINLVFPEGKGKYVGRLNQKQIDQLRGYLLGQRVLKGNKIESSLIHKNNCIAIGKSYGIKKESKCPLDYGKTYVSPNGSVSGCEFYRCPISRLEENLTGGDN